MKEIILYSLICPLAICAQAQRLETCRAVLKGGTIVIENELIGR